jgi:hypothetical protein
MKSYIIRLYRNEKGGSRQLLGTVERPGEDVKLAFTSFDELRNILILPGRKDTLRDRKGTAEGPEIRSPLSSGKSGPENKQGEAIE